MSTKQNKKTTLSLDGFRGIDQRLWHTGEPVAQDLVNFRIRADGSLEKRSGYRLLADMGAPIRAFYPTIHRGRVIGYTLVGNTFYSVDLTTGEKTVLGTVGTNSGSACFLQCKNVLYLTDGEEMYVFVDGTLRLAGGYIPLIGKDWLNAYVGKPHEPKNLLTRRARISYVVSEEMPSIFMCTGEPVESVEAVYRNGVLLESDQYYIDEEFETINVLGSLGGDRLEIYMTMKSYPQELRSLFLSASRSIAFGGTNNQRLFFWGCSDPTLMFCTAYVSEAQAAASALQNTLDNDLYVPVGYEFQVGAGAHRIQDCAYHYERLLIFTEGNTWMASPDASGLDEFSLSAIHNDIGCASVGGVAQVGNHPISLGRHCLYQWHQEGDVLNRCNAVRVSEEIDGLLSPTDFQNSGLYYDSNHNELWLFNRVSGVIWICNLSDRNWYRFTGIFADRLFDADGHVGFLRDRFLYVFDDAWAQDMESNNNLHPIQATYVGSLTDFGTETYKNLSSLILKGEGGGGSLFFSFLGDETGKTDTKVFEDDSSPHLVTRKRLSSGRFHCGNLTLTAPGGGRQVIHSLTLHTR